MLHEDIKILFLVNGKIRKQQRLVKQLNALAIPDSEIIITDRAKTAVEIVKTRAHKFSHIIAVGGDGTIHEVINGIMAGIEDRSGPVISLIPTGTANDFAKSLDFPVTPLEVVQMLSKGKIMEIDIGEIELHDENGNNTKLWFNNIADAGIGPAVVEEVNRQSKKINANIAFFRAIIKTFRYYKNISICCEAEDWKWEGPIKMLAVANGKYFGSGLCIAPHAALDDGKFAVTIVGNVSIRDYIFNLPSLKMRRKINHPQVFYKDAKEVRITSVERCPIEADGELLGYTPLTIKILPKRLKFLIISD